MRAAQLQPPPAQGLAFPPPPQLSCIVPPPEHLPGTATPLKQQLSLSAAAPAAHLGRVAAARVPSWPAPFQPAPNPAAMSGSAADLELSEEALFREDHDGQVCTLQHHCTAAHTLITCHAHDPSSLFMRMCRLRAHRCTIAQLMHHVSCLQDPAADAMSSEDEDEPQPQLQAAHSGISSSMPRSTPGGPPVAGNDSSESSDEDLDPEFAQAAALHRSSSAGVLAGVNLCGNCPPN